MRWFDQFQNGIMNIYRLGVRLLVEEMSGLALRESSSPMERVEIFILAWPSNPQIMANAMAGACAENVPLTDIYSDMTPAHTKWQKVYKMCDVQTHHLQNLAATSLFSTIIYQLKCNEQSLSSTDLCHHQLKRH